MRKLIAAFMGTMMLFGVGLVSAPAASAQAAPKCAKGYQRVVMTITKGGKTQAKAVICSKRVSKDAIRFKVSVRSYKKGKVGKIHSGTNALSTWKLRASDKNTTGKNKKYTTKAYKYWCVAGEPVRIKTRVSINVKGTTGFMVYRNC